MPAANAEEQLTPADASNVILDARDQVNVFLMAGILGVGGFVGADGSTDLPKLRAEIAARLGTDSLTPLRRLRQRVRDDAGQLVWQPCKPDYDWHVRATERVEGTDGLADLCATLMTTPLAVSRPLWEVLIVPGAGAHPGIVLRVHHAVADGVAMVALVQLLFGQAPPAAAPRATPASVAASKPKGSLRLSLVRRGMRWA